jgi:NAD(P)H-dependent flavin oxidoreductase YrpB (nitropropane dioxygenase family)
VALRHPQVKLVVSALGAPPKELVDELHGRGILVGSLCGKAEHAKAQRAVGVDIIVAQGTEAGGHTGQIATMVLVPQVVDVAGPDIAVLAAGGISRGRQIAAALRSARRACGPERSGWARARASSRPWKKRCFSRRSPKTPCSASG